METLPGWLNAAFSPGELYRDGQLLLLLPEKHYQVTPVNYSPVLR
jgi:hypothetical protein